jgi:TonB family protein
MTKEGKKITRPGVRKKWNATLGFIVLANLVLAPVAKAPVDLVTNSQKPQIPCGNSSITGVISLKGGAPWSLIDMSSDPFCADANRDEPQGAIARSKNRTEAVVVNDQWKLTNVMVFLKGKQVDSCKTGPSSEGQLFDHQDCKIVPHVVGLQQDQFLALSNIDKTEHEYCVSPAYNPSWCVTLGPGERNQEKTFPVAERFIQVSCRRHPWERAYLAVFDHPLFSVSDKDGKYEIKGVPPGEYTVAVWHEYYGERSFPVTIGPNEHKTMNFTIDEMIPAEKLAKPLIERSEQEMLEAAVHKVEPVYPERAGRFRQDGKVEVRVILDEEGNVTRAYALAGYPLLQDNAIIAARDWKFKPTMQNGMPVKVMGSIIFDFKIPDNIKLPSTTHYEMSPSDKVIQFFGPLTRPFSITITLQNKTWNPNEPLIAELQFKNTIDKIVLLDLKGKYYFAGQLTDKRKLDYRVLWDTKGSGAKPDQEDYTELAPGGTYTLTLRSTAILDALRVSENVPWASHLSGKYKLAVFYVSGSGNPSLPGEWVGQAMSNQVELNVK